RPDTFWHASLLETANDLVSTIREVRPQVLVTYDDFGGYGHPDHIKAHQVAHYAAVLAGVRSHRLDLGEPWSVSRVYWSAMSATRMREGLRELRASGDATTFEGMDPENLPPMAIADEHLDVAIRGEKYVGAKQAALRAHATQVAVDGPFFALTNNLGQRIW